MKFKRGKRKKKMNPRDKIKGREKKKEGRGKNHRLDLALQFP